MHWVFEPEQLNRALIAYNERRSREGESLTHVNCDEQQIRAFLLSPEAKAAGLREEPRS